MKILHRIVSLSRVLHWVLTSIAILLVVLTVTGLVVIRTQRFRDYVRRRIVEQVETTTHGRFEYGRFVFNWERLTAEMTQVVLHGKETEGAPLVAADSVTLGLRIISLFERKVDLARVRIERPRVHIVFYDDGSTNIPEPHRKTTWAEDVLDLAVRDYEAVDGVVEYNETRIPLRVHGEGLRIRMSYEPGRVLYRGDIATERVQLAPLGYGPIPTSLSAAFTLEKSRLAFSRIRISTRESRVDFGRFAGRCSRTAWRIQRARFDLGERSRPDIQVTRRAGRYGHAGWEIDHRFRAPVRPQRKWQTGRPRSRVFARKPENRERGCTGRSQLRLGPAVPAQSRSPRAGRPRDRRRGSFRLAHDPLRRRCRRRRREGCRCADRLPRHPLDRRDGRPRSL